MGKLTYRDAGVDLELYGQSLAGMVPFLKQTHTPRVLDGFGGFASLFTLEYNPFARSYRNPVLVSCTDGVGTKLKVAGLMNRHDTVGIDLVAMSVNDCLCTGGEPLFFLDYLALPKDDPALIAELVKGISAGCLDAGCALVGGETAILPDLYQPGDYDLAGFCVGVVERDYIIDGRYTEPGDVVLGLASTGLHSNGYSLARKVIFEHAGLKVTDHVPELGRTVGEALLEPTRIYVRTVLDLLRHFSAEKRLVRALAHITGEGLPGNIPRVLPPGTSRPSTPWKLDRAADLHVATTARRYRAGGDGNGLQPRHRVCRHRQPRIGRLVMPPADRVRSGTHLCHWRGYRRRAGRRVEPMSCVPAGNTRHQSRSNRHRGASSMKCVIHAAIPIALLVCAAWSTAQEKPTKRDPRPTNDATVRQRLDAEAASLVALYKQLHAHPELALQEEKTAARLAKELRQAGFDVTEKFGGTGVVAVLKNGAGPTILVRADMDGLPIEEQTGVPYASKERMRDRDGLNVGVMHACGHDINMTCLVGTARVLAGMKDRWKGTLVFIGQPAEETGQGAKAMLEAGLFEKFPRPDYGLALHCDVRYAHGHVNYRIGQLQANVDSVDIVVRGRGGHGAAPHTTVDPVVLAARMVLDLQTLVSRERDPFEPVVVTVGSIHGGTKHNIIPSEVKLQLTVRTLTDASRKAVLDGIVRIVRAVAVSAQAPEPIVRHAAGEYTPALVNHPELAHRMIALLKDVVGPERVHERPPSMGGEDFSRFGLAGVPTFYYHLGSLAPERIDAARKGGPALPAMHGPFYYPVPEPTIRTGVLTMALAVLELLNQPRKIPVLFDTDIGDDIDDAFALALLLASAEIDLRGVTTSFGDTHTRAFIACRMLHAAGRKDVPVAAGRSAKLSDAPRGQMQYGVAVAGVRLPEKEPAVEFLYRQLKAHPGELTLLAVGPLTNFADLLTLHPDCKPWIKRLVIMGGSVRIGYDGKAKPEVEWNIKCNVKAAQTVFASGVPLVVAPLDATGTVALGPDAQRRIFEAHTPLTDELHALCKLWGAKTPVLFDPVAVALCITDRFCTMEDLCLAVDDQGNTRIGKGKANARVATAIRHEEFVRWYLARVAPK